MKLLLIATLAILASAHAEDASDTRNVDGITFTLFTRLNPNTGQQLILNDASSIANSQFRSNRPTRFITHGWRSNDNSVCTISIRTAALVAENCNVIVVDWNSLQGLIANPLAIVRNGSTRVAAFINFMQKVGDLDLGTTQLIGHSLGAHLFSAAARAVNGNIGTVVGLDPAGGSIWESLTIAINLGIQSGDANHVQVIHTNAGGMGLERLAGDSDFYPNGGASQPGCPADPMGVCSHFRACGFYAESLINPTSFRSDEDDTVYMGGRTLSTHARGRYTLTTGSSSLDAQE